MSSNSFSTLPPNLTDQITRKDDYPQAQGAFGNVWRCVWRTDPSPEIETIQVPGGKENVHQELIRWRQLNHENIARLLGVASGFGHLDTSISMVSNWFPNGTLTTFLASPHDTFNRRQRLELLQGVAAGVLYLHTSEVVHGNLSGNNVLIDDLGKARLTDFGLSAASGGFRGASYLGQAGRPGAIRWAAPELIEGQHSTFESDIYSFGSIMLQVLSGELPWSEVEVPDEHIIIQKLTKGQVPRWPSSVSRDHYNFIRKCWSPARSSSRPSAFRIDDFVKNTQIHVWRSPDSALRHAVRSVIRWIKIRTASPASRCPAEGSDGAFQVLNDAVAIHEKTESSSGPGMDCKGTQSQPSIAGGGAIYPTRTLVTAPGPLALPLRTSARPLFYNRTNIPSSARTVAPINRARWLLLTRQHILI
ncbi:kinase-like domain-containing protein [Suillus lakei]|nr:kinase-like domain-containing protein [Suillus lakei]